VKFLEPFEIDHRHDADAHIRVTRNVNTVGYDRAVKAFVEQQVRIFGERLPWREMSCRQFPHLGLGFIMHIVARATVPGLAELPKGCLEFSEQIGLRPEVAKVAIALLGLRAHHTFHLHPIVAVEGIAFDIGGFNVFAMENRLERASHGRSAGAGGAGNGNDGMRDGHINSEISRDGRRAVSAPRSDAVQDGSDRAARPPRAIRIGAGCVDVKSGVARRGCAYGPSRRHRLPARSARRWGSLHTKAAVAPGYSRS